MKKTFRPKADVGDDLQITAALPRAELGVDEQGNAVFNREVGEVFEVSEWPYTTEDAQEIDYLMAHEMVTDRPPPPSAPKQEKREFAKAKASEAGEQEGSGS